MRATSVRRAAAAGGVRAAIAPLRLLAPFSITIASTCPDFKVLTSVPYLAYTIGGLLACTAVTWWTIVRTSTTSAPALFNRVGTLFVAWAFHAGGTMRLLIDSRKDKIKKLIDELEQLDRLFVAADVPPEPRLGIRSYAWGILAFHGVMVAAVLYMELQRAAGGASAAILAVMTCTTLALDAELLCALSFVGLLAGGLRRLRSHMAGLLRGARPGSGRLDILDCYRKMLHILKRINTIWRTQINILLAVELYFSSEALLRFNMEYYGSIDSGAPALRWLRAASLARRVLRLAAAGGGGQRLARSGDGALDLARALVDSHLPARTRRQAADCVRAGSARARAGGVLARAGGARPRAGGVRLLALGATPLDARLAMRALAAVVAAYIFCLQVGVFI